MITSASLADALSLLRQRRPLVHNITSAVVANFTANALLALGAAPVMAEGADEVALVAAAADALVVNLGMLTPQRASVMRAAVAAAVAAGRPWVLDPVGVGAIAPRTGFARELCRLRPAAIRGNASEILGLLGEGGGRGVDTTAGSEAAVAVARQLARETGAVVAVTGAVDYVTDGARLMSLHNGDPMMTRVTGMGCAATAIAGACLATAAAPLAGVADALSIVGIAGETAAQGAAGPGSMQIAFLDALAAPDASRLRIEQPG